MVMYIYREDRQGGEITLRDTLSDIYLLQEPEAPQRLMSYSDFLLREPLRHGTYTGNSLGRVSSSLSP